MKKIKILLFTLFIIFFCFESTNAETICKDREKFYNMFTSINAESTYNLCKEKYKITINKKLLIAFLLLNQNDEEYEERVEKSRLDCLTICKNDSDCENGLFIITMHIMEQNKKKDKNYDRKMCKLLMEKN